VKEKQKKRKKNLQKNASRKGKILANNRKSSRIQHRSALLKLMQLQQMPAKEKWI
jgi:hypothetical protein